MEINIHLLIHNIVTIASAVASLGVALFSFLNGKRQTANIAISLTFVGVAVFFTSHIIGVNIANPELSKQILMFNLVMFLIGAFNLHAVLALTENDKSKRWLVIFMYAAAAIFTILFVIFNNLFLLPSAPKMYFPNYYVPGSMNWVRVAFLYVITVPLCLYYIALAYFKAKTVNEKNQLKYLFVTMVVGYSIAYIPNFLVYGIKIDPLWGTPAALVFIIPFLYGSVQYGLFNVRIIAKQAFYYSLMVALIGGFIALLNFSSRWIVSAYPDFPVWIIYFASAVLAVTISVIIWQKLRDGDMLKYEFITIMTHKFRTPLTGIRWAAENLSKANLTEAEATQVGYIKSENAKLVEITNLLMSVSDAENESFGYNSKPDDLSKMADEVATSLSNPASEKGVEIIKKLTPEIYANFDPSRLKFIIQVFIENAIHYTPKNGKIAVSVYRDGRNAVCSVSDTGIGIAKEEIPLLFTKFYRGRKAKLSDTEGMGIGLFVSKEIIIKQRGKIWAESEGVDKGSTFYFSLRACPRPNA